MKKFIFIFALLLILTPFMPTKAEGNPLEVYIFTQTGCPHCATVLSHLAELQKGKYPTLVVNDFDLRKDPKFYSKYTEFANAYKSTADAVPMTYIGDRLIQGADLEGIDSAIENCVNTKCQNPEKFVTQYLKDNPSEKAPGDTSNRSIGGFIILGLIVVAGVVIYINKA